MSREFVVIWALMRRGLNEIVRVPGAAIPGVLAPAIFMIGLSAVFGKVVSLPGFDTDSYREFILPVGLLQGAGFSGAATGVNLGRDIEQGLFDRLLVAPVRRTTLLLGIVLSAGFRALIPGTFLTLVGLALGVSWPGIVGLLVAFTLLATIATVAACWGAVVALKFRTQQAAPLVQAGAFGAILCTTANAPQQLLTGWIEPVARYSPVTRVLEGIRQGFVGDVTLTHTWHAFAAVIGLGIFFGLLALRGMRKTGS